MGKLLSKTKVGDRIRITKSTWGYPVGTMGTVTKVHTSGIQFQPDTDKRFYGAWEKDEWVVIGQTRSIVEILNDNIS